MKRLTKFMKESEVLFKKKRLFYMKIALPIVKMSVFINQRNGSYSVLILSATNAKYFTFYFLVGGGG